MNRLRAKLSIGLAIVLTATLAAGQSAPARGLTQRIEEARYLPIGGIDQWVTIRGDDNRKPLLLLLHGGPGDVQSPFIATYAPYERDFVLVQWDQRGGGRTFEKYGQATPDLTLARQIDDGIELAEQLHKRFPKNRLILLGHSWGTIVGTGMVQKRPGLFSAYVGTGQVASWAATVNYQFDFLVAAARKAGDQKTVAELEAIGHPNPLNIRQYFAINRTMRANSPPADANWFAGIPERLKATPGLTEADITAGSSGMNFSGGALITTLTHVDLTMSAPSFPVRYCVIQGDDDLNAPTSAAKAYFDKIVAPKKRFAVIKGGGHFALATHPAEFIADMKACLGR